MAKTRRHKTNKSPLKPFENSKAVILNKGVAVQVAGYRAEGKQVKAADGTAIAIGRVYTGVPRGKTYPYASVKRGGADPAALVPQIKGRKTVAVTG
jgi:hypothetical protein